MSEEPQNPYAPPKSEPPTEENPYWGRTSLLDRLRFISVRGRLRLTGLLLLRCTGLLAFFADFVPCLALVGAIFLLSSHLLPKSLDD
jgi:hypothetical protein